MMMMCDLCEEDEDADKMVRLTMRDEDRIYLDRFFCRKCSERIADSIESITLQEVTQ